MAGYGIGSSVPRVEDARLLAGRGQYVDDVILPRQLYGAVLYSPHAHARIVAVDTSAAEQAEGVLLVLTGKDAASDGIGAFAAEFLPGGKGFKTQQPVLAIDTVRYVGDRVAFVVAETAAQARDAAELIEIEYAALEPATSLSAATAPGAPAVWPQAPDNISFAISRGNEAATDAAFARAAHAVRLRLVNNRISANAIEPRASIGAYSPVDRSYTLYTATQNPHATRGVLCHQILHEPESNLRVVAGEVGGGFGMKGGTYPEDALVLWASRRLERPVKWTATRAESLFGDSHGRDQIVDAEMALDDSGKILAVRMAALNNVGGYLVGAGPIPVMSVLRMVPGAYDIAAVHLATKAVFTNTTPTAPYRGAGQPEAMFIIERLIEEAALKLGIEPVELRRRNFVAPSAMPYKSASGEVYDSGDFGEAMRRCLALADWEGFEARRAGSRAAGKLRGRALIYYIEANGVFNERMELRFDPTGGVTILAGTFSHGQGHETTYAQMVSDWLGVPLESVRFIQGDTARVAFGRGTYGSRSGMVGGGALQDAAEGIVAKGKILAAHLLEAAEADLEFATGAYTVAGTDRSMRLVDVAKASFRSGGLPKGFGVGLEAVGTFDPTASNYPNGCHVCEVEIDPDTGLVEVVKYDVVDDVGVVINPMIVDGQIHGGLAQGIGQALYEQIAYDPGSGQLLSGSFMDYGMPRADQMPLFTTEFNEIPCRTNPLGIKGAGEAGCVGAPPAVVNAILDALRPLGVDDIEMPATPLRVWQAIEAARASGRTA